MNFTCPACHTSYTIEDGRVRGRVVRARCRTCGMAIDVAKLTQQRAGVRTRVGREAPQPADDALPRFGMPSEPDSDDAPTHAFESPVFRHGNDAARRADARPKRDLFAPAMPEDVPAIREIPAPLPHAAGPVGQRSENSVLFTLAALEPPKRRAEAAKAAVPVDDHSGMIDLFALSRAAKSSVRESSPVFPMEPPLGAFTTELSPPLARPPRASRKVQLVAAGVVSAMITGLAAFLIIGATSEAPTASAPPRPAAVAAAPPAPVAAPPAAAQPDPIPVASKSTSPAGRGKAKGAKPAGHRASVPTTTKSRAPAAPAAGSDPCHCRGNLMCAMKCSV